LLIVFQLLANWTQGYIVAGRSVLVLIFWIVKLIGFSYRAALDPDNGFFLSFVGFTCGVGLCEELCKALPLFVHFRRRPWLTWRGAFLWGLASGAGFGISEGVTYAGNEYNGFAPASAYVVRFISCVALHAVWSGSVAITLYRCQDLIQGEMNWYEFIPPVFRILGIAMILHGLYDTLLKKDMDALALVVAVISFLWLAWQMWSMSREEEEGVATAPARA
jgi:RsiW-degrading membrane proteinase PrsW (M82 family)